MDIANFNSLNSSNLNVDTLYEGGNAGNAAADSISKLLPGLGNQGGFRYEGKKESKKYIVLYTSGADKDWPKSYYLNTGLFTYFGDNKVPGRELLNTPKKGNLILRNVFNLLHSDQSDRYTILPFFVFEQQPTSKSSRSVRFKGLAVPGGTDLDESEDLVAVWNLKDGRRYQNYQAIFTILNESNINREWVKDLIEGNPDSPNAPKLGSNGERKGFTCL